MLRYIPLAAAIISQPVFAASSGQSSSTAERQIETVVLASNACVLSDVIEDTDDRANFLGPVLGFLFPLAVEYLFDAASEELTKVRKQTSSGVAEFHLWKRGESAAQPRAADPAAARNIASDGLIYNMPGCVTVLTGKFTRKPDAEDRFLADPALTLATKVSNNPGPQDLVARLRANGIEFESLNMIFEARSVQSDDTTSFAYHPQLVAVYDLLPGNGRRKQGLVIDLAMQGPGTSPWGTVYSSAAISFGEVETGLNMDRRGADRRKLEKLDTGLMTYPGISQDAYAALRREGGDDLEAVMPARLRAEWTQTRKPSSAARVLAFLISKAKPKASGWVGERFDADAAFNEQQANEALEIAYLDAKVKLESLPADASQSARDLAELREKRAREAWERSQQ